MIEIFSEEGRAIYATDKPRPDGAHCGYLIAIPMKPPFVSPITYFISMQGEAIAGCEDYGLRDEDLLRIVQHRLECFQAGPYVCYSNESAIHHIREALSCLEISTQNRGAQSIEGEPHKDNRFNVLRLSGTPPFDEAQVDGAFDGTRVISDADPGL